MTGSENIFTQLETTLESGDIGINMPEKRNFT